MWGGRFEGGPADVMRAINASIAVDKRLWREDIAASKAHAAMLGGQGILTADEAAEILSGLDAVAAEYAAGKEVWRLTGDLDWTGPEATKLLAEAS